MAIDRVAFQRELWRRLQDATGKTVEASLLSVSIGQERWVIPLELTEQVLPMQPMQAVPRTVSWFCGLIHVRGSVHGVVDLGQARGHGRTPRDNNCRIVMLANRGDVAVGLLISRSHGLRRALSLDEVAGNVGERRWVKRELQDESGIRWQELDVIQLLNDPVFNNIAA